jgi:hypothetical protein
MTAVKITICGRECEYDPDQRTTMADAVAVEETVGVPYAMLREQMGMGQVKAMAGWAWLTLHRNGADVDYDDMLSGAVDFDIDQFIADLIRIGVANAAAEAAEAAEADPTGGVPSDQGGSLPADPDGTAMTSNGTSRSSRRATASGPGRSGS